MFSKIFNLIKKFIVAVLLIYAYNKMSISMGMFIPMNIFTILLVTFCGLPSIVMLVLFSFLCI